MKSVRERGKRSRAVKGATRDNPSHLRTSLLPPPAGERPALIQELAPARGKRTREADRRTGADRRGVDRSPNDRSGVDRSGSFDRNANPGHPAPRLAAESDRAARVAPPVRAVTGQPKSSQAARTRVAKSSNGPRRAAPLLPVNERGAESPRAQAIPVRTVATPRPDLRIPSISVENVDWEDTSEATTLSPLARWARTERELKKRLEDLGAQGHACRADLREGRFVWIDEAGSAVVEARAQLVCTLAQPSLALTMAWADPILSSLAVPLVADLPDEQSLPDDESAREIALRAADACGAEFVYRMPAPHVDYFLALRALKPTAAGAVVTPGSPVGLVLRGLADLRRSLSSRTEPTSELRARFYRLGKSFAEHADRDFKDTEWVGRLTRAGRLVTSLTVRLAPPTFTAIAAGLPAEEWLPHAVAVELTDALKLLEDEWGAFAV